MIARLFGNSELKARLMMEMIDRLGIDLTRMAHQTFGAGFGQVARACRFCTKTEVCHAWLSGSTEVDRSTFCPNAARFDAMPHRTD